MDPQAKIIIGSKLKLFLGGVVFASPNCYDTEKVSRIRARLGANLEVHSGWTDHPADIPMLNLAERKNVICPKSKHMTHFERAFGQDGYSLRRWTPMNGNSP